MTTSKNMTTWRHAGQHVFPLMPFLDNVIVRSEGSYLIDQDGNRILDLAAGQFCTVLGHNHPAFIERLVAELKYNLHTGSQYLAERVFEALRAVAEVTPNGLDKIALFSTGTEANEFALRVAKAYTGRTGVIGFDRGYYGISQATRSLSSISDGHIDLSPKVPGTMHIVAPNCSRCPLGRTYPECDIGCLDLSMRMIGSNRETVAAIIVETVVSAGGMIFPQREYFARLREIADDLDALLIVDEAQTGFGRCGAWFDCQHLDLRPDILVFSKTSGNGYPSSGVAVSERIVDKLLDQGFFHLSSHQNDPLTAAAVLAVIDIIRSEQLLDAARNTGTYFLDGLRSLQSRHSCVWGARGRGLMLAFDLVADRDSMRPDPKALISFVLGCQARGVHLTHTYYEGALRIIPALTISRQDIDFALNVFDDTLTDLVSGRLDPGKFHNTNPVVRSILSRSRVRKSLRRLWETSPSYWLRKLKE